MTAQQDEYRDNTVYYFCPSCDWKGTDADVSIKMSGIPCPVCNCCVLIDAEMMDDLEGLDDDSTEQAN